MENYHRVNNSTLIGIQVVRIQYHSTTSKIVSKKKVWKNQKLSPAKPRTFLISRFLPTLLSLNGIWFAKNLISNPLFRHYL